MDFNTFKNRGKEAYNSSNSNGNTYSQVSQDRENSENIENDARRAIDEYSHMSHDEMMNALFDAVNREKSKGLFDIDNIWQFYREISPMLDSDSKRRMYDIIEAISVNNR